MNKEERRSRIELSEKLRESAEHLSEAEMRSSLSRMYYAVYHVALVLLGKYHAHGEIARRLGMLDPHLVAQFKELQRLREGADYGFDFVVEEFGTLEGFRLQFGEKMQRGSSLYQRIRELLEQQE